MQQSFSRWYMANHGPMIKGLLYYRHSRYQSDIRKPQCLLTSGLPRNHYTRRNPKCNLRLQMDVRYGNDQTGNGLVLQGLPAHLV